MKSDEMVDILKDIHKYVASVPYSKQKQLSTGVVTTKEKASMHRIVVGGDQLTAARIRAA